MSKEQKVSVICLTFNHEKYVESCLEGFVKQKTDFAFEVLVHDDASSDRTAEIIKQYQQKYPDIIVPVLQKDNVFSKGINIVSEILLPMAKGKYIAFCEGDDAWVDENKLQMQVDYLESHLEYSACVHNTYFHHCGKKVKDFPMFIWQTDTDLSFEDIMKWSAYGYQTSSLVTRKDLIREVPPFGYNEFPLAVFLVLCGKIHFIARVMSVYRFRSSDTSTRANVLSKKKMEKEYADSIDELENMHDYVSEEKKSLVQAKINGYRSALNKVSEMTDEEYAKSYNKNERTSNIKYFIRSNFQWLYKQLKKIQISMIINRK